MEVSFSSRNFSTHLNECFHELFLTKDLTDVTLVFDNQLQLEAHKIILNAWSPVFRSMLTTNPHPHPMVFLKGMSYQNVLAILTFLYQGEVTIPKDSVEEFLSDAEYLQISQFLLDSTEIDKKTERESGNQIKLFQESGTGSIEESVAVIVEDSATPGNSGIPEGIETNQGFQGLRLEKRSEKRVGSGKQRIYKSASKYPCEDCETSYNTRNGLWYHRRAKHQSPWGR